MNFKRQEGFTFIEVLIACGLIVITGLALFQVFSQGLRVWNAVKKRQADIDYLIFSEKFTHDLQNSFMVSEQPFEGDSDFSEFNTLNISRGGGREEIYRIRYAYDGGAQAIKKIAWDYKDILNGESGKSVTVLNKVRSCKIQYYGATPGQEREWFNRYKQSCLPEAVKISIEIEELGNNKNFVRIVPIAQGGCAS